MRQYIEKNSYTERLYLENLRRMNGEKKLTITSQLSELTRELSRCGIRKRNPQLSKECVEKELWRIIRHDTE
jgi:hypothetical protein